MLHINLSPPERVAQRVNDIRRTFRHPDVSAIAARVPVVRDRVPLRVYWERRPIDPVRMMRHAGKEAQQRLPQVAARARASSASASSALATRARTTTTAAAAGARGAAARAPRSRWIWLLAALGIGAATMYYADRQSGRRRRALVRDKLAHMKRVLTRKLPRAAERRGRFIRGKMEGVRHDVQELAAVGVQRGVADNETLVARVRSEVLRRSGVNPGEIHVDAYEGCVTLRGQMHDDSEIRRLVDATRHVEGVQEVRSYLHLPGTVPPNKAEAYQSAKNGAVPAHLAR
jgi:hypothetical protein